MEKYAYGTTKDLVSLKNKLNVTMQLNNTKMINFNDIAK